MKSTVYFQVAPRYAGGSPGMVPEETARRVALQEKDCYDAHLQGIYGPEEKAKAEAKGLDGIVQSQTERGSKLYCEDLITGRKSVRFDCKVKDLRVGDRIIRAVHFGVIERCGIEIAHITSATKGYFRLTLKDLHSSVLGISGSDSLWVERTVSSEV